MKKTYNIEVDCANCALKMEEAVKKLSGVKNVTLSFMSQKMNIELEDNCNLETKMEEVAKTCKKVDDDFSIEL